MRERVRIAAAEILPDSAAVLSSMGRNPRAGRDERLEALMSRALSLLADEAEPGGLWAEVSTADFAVIHEGEGGNEPATPLQAIYPRADLLALLAVTLGEGVSRRIACRDKIAGFFNNLGSASAIDVRLNRALLLCPLPPGT